MCNQTAALIARALEESGIATVTLSLLKEITQRVPPPRALFVPYGFGFPLGRPNDDELQMRIIQRCLEMLEGVSEPGEILDFEQ